MTETAPWLASSVWPTVPIKYVAKLGTGHTPSRQRPDYWVDCTIPWITLADVWQIRDGSHRTIEHTAERISPLGVANSAAVVHTAGSVVLSRTASVGFSAIMGADMATSQDFAVWTCGPTLLPEFLLYVLRAMAPDLRRVAAGSTHKTIYMPDIEQLRTPLPPIDAQRAIVADLSRESGRHQALVDARTTQLRLLDEADELAITEVYDQLAADHSVVRLRYALTGVEQGWSPECDQRVPLGDEWGVVRAGCVNRGRFDPGQAKTLPAGVAPRTQFLLQDGDLIMSRASGSPELIGSVGVVTGLAGRRLMLSDKLYRLRYSSAGMPEFLALMLRAARVRSLIRLGTSGAEGLARNLPTPVVRDLPVPLPPLPVQREAVARLTRRLQLHEQLRRELAGFVESARLRHQALITRAVTGHSDVAREAA